MGTATPTTQLPSLVVLPFVNTSADLENEFFCDGLAEDLISALTKLAQLRVVARTSAFSFKGQNLDVREIGRQLNVGAVLEGSVRRAGNRLRITAQIVNVADGFDLWSERYDRQLTDIFDIQDEITLAIVEALKVKLLSGQQAVLLKRPTDNLEAWEWYQKALWHHSLFNPTSFNKAIECCQKAVETDPGFATAWAWLSVIYSGLIAWTGINQAEYLAMAGECAQKAIGLDDRLAESHAAMGIYQSTAFDVQTGGRYLRRALDLNPNQPSLRHGYAVYYLAPQGLFDEALAEFQCAHHSDPLSMPISSATGYAFYVARRYEEGVAHLRPLIEMAPNFAANYLELGRNLSQLGRLEESIEALHNWIETIRAYPKPVLAAIEGAAAGAGFSLALACDLIVASRSALASGSTSSAGTSTSACNASSSSILLKPFWPAQRDVPAQNRPRRARGLRFLREPTTRTSRSRRKTPPPTSPLAMRGRRNRPPCPHHRLSWSQPPPPPRPQAVLTGKS